MTGRETVCRVEPSLADHVRQLLGDAGLISDAGDPGSDGRVPIVIDDSDSERARAVIGLVLPQLLEDPDGPGTVHLSDRLIRTEDPQRRPPPIPDDPPAQLPGGLVDGRSVSGYTDPLAEPELGDEEFTPPPPPPIPAPKDPLNRAAWLGVIFGPILLLMVQIFGLDWMWTTVGVVAFFGGFGVLIARMEDRPPRDDDGPDGGGAVL